jgi:hypothetical protein
VIPIDTAPAPEEKRRVKVNVSGAKGGTVRIDGTAIDWLRDTPELKLGAHTFQGVPPDEKCCEATKPFVYEILPGEGPQTVTVHIPFRKATISLAGPPGAEVRCPIFFSGTVKAGSSKSFELSGTKSAECTILGPNPEDPPKTITVELAPGDSFAVTARPPEQIG